MFYVPRRRSNWSVCFLTGCRQERTGGHWSVDVVLHWRVHRQRRHHWLWCLTFGQSCFFFSLERCTLTFLQESWEPINRYLLLKTTSLVVLWFLYNMRFLLAECSRLSNTSVSISPCRTLLSSIFKQCYILYTVNRTVTVVNSYNKLNDCWIKLAASVSELLWVRLLVWLLFCSFLVWSSDKLSQGTSYYGFYFL